MSQAVGTRKVQKRRYKISKGEIRRKKREALARINYLNVATTVALPLAAVWYLVANGMPVIPAENATFVFGLVYFNFTMLCFTAGYHKYFAHKSFSVRWAPLRYVFAIGGAALGLGSARWWAGLHRAHHQFTDDTERDPYSIKRGLAWAQWGWLIRKPKTSFLEEFIDSEFPLEGGAGSGDNEVEVEPRGRSETVDVEIDSSLQEGNDDQNKGDEALLAVVRWQAKYYPVLFVLMGLVVPSAIVHYFCHDTWVSGLIYTGLVRMLISQQAMLMVESLFHSKSLHFLFPMQPFNDKNSSINSLNPVFAFLTYGQAGQNYHHEFPHDYRATSSTLAYDPTKWCIWGMAQLGLVDQLCTTPEQLIAQLQIQQQQSVINRMKSQLNWGTPISKLPILTATDFKRVCQEADKDRIYIVIQNIIHDITPFMDQHPGGVPLLRASHGKDATKAFYGGVYGHSAAATNLLATMRIAVLSTGNEEDVWKRVASEEREVRPEERDDKRAYQSAEAA
ncbi:acyl-CoA desaturase 1 [Diutina catenulata]